MGLFRLIGLSEPPPPSIARLFDACWEVRPEAVADCPRAE